MKKVELMENEEFKYLTIQAVVEKRLSINGAANKLQVTKRHIRRLKSQYENCVASGGCAKEVFRHKNRNRPSNRKIKSETDESILNLWANKYYEFNYTHFLKHLKSDELITISYSHLRTLLLNNRCFNKKLHKITKRAIQKTKSEVKSDQPTSQVVIPENFYLDPNPHPSRPRRKYFGELIQLDASKEHWFGPNNEKATLHLAIDDNSGWIVGGCFKKEETLDGYYQSTKQIIEKYGIPSEIFTDNRSVFNYKSDSRIRSINQTSDLTQFGYAMSQLGVKLTTSSIPQAKGRIERNIQTAQGRWIDDLRLENITDIESANIWLETAINEFNQEFGLMVDYSNSVFTQLPESVDINLVLSRIEKRSIGGGHTVKFQNHFYSLHNSMGVKINIREGLKVLVIKTFDNQLYASCGEYLYCLQVIPEYEAKSKEFDNDSKLNGSIVGHIPPMIHPWKAQSYENYLRKQIRKYRKQIA
jgi:hypothetical protein